MTEEQINLLHWAWNWSDAEDKSTEFMLQYMSDMSGVDYDEVVDFVAETSLEERQKWLQNIDETELNNLVLSKLYSE